jgi:CAAX prenyl protease-like protein
VLGGRRVGLLANHDEQERSGGTNPAAMYLVPMLAIIATAMVCTAFSVGFDYLYPLRVLAAAGAFWFYRRQIAALDWKPSLSAIVPGVLVFVLWIALASAPGGGVDAAFAAGLGSMSAIGGAAWLLFRVIGAIVTVPLAEELAFRGYLIRKLVAADFEAVPAGQFTWLSFLGSSILFGALHGQWIPGILAGLLFATTLYRRGALADAVLAHSTANALLSVYVLTTHRWFLWT